MENLDVFRLLGLSVIFIYFLIRLNFYYKNKLILHGHFDKREGKIMFVIRNFCALIGYVYVLLYLLGKTNFGYFSLPITVKIVAAICLFGSLILLFVIHKNLGLNFTPTLSIKKEHKLVTHGFYKYVRHPMYTALLMLNFFGSFTISNFISIIFFFIALFYILKRIPDEEKLMIDEFHGEYIEYQMRTGALLPKLF